MSYENTLTSYRCLLEENPGKALRIGEDCVAILVDGYLCGAHLAAQDNGFDVGVSFDFDQSGWDSDNDCWDADLSTGNTAYCISHPEFISLK
ncbi:hypothetical protein D3C81_989100 [compost metagenome]